MITDFAGANNSNTDLQSPEYTYARAASEVITSNKKEPFLYENPKYDIINEFEIIEVEKQR